jgi:hypothetical protein
MRPPNPPVEFAQHAFSAHRGEGGVPVETIYYATELGEPRYRTFGIFVRPDDQRWSMTWADYGRVSPYRFEATSFPANPVATFSTREEALMAAERAAIDFRFVVNVHTDPPGVQQGP